MDDGRQTRESAWSLYVLRRADQATVATLALIALLAIAAFWIVQGGLQGQLIDVDAAPRRDLRFSVDINTADWPELAELPGIGETLAKRIVESREREGPFADHAQLRRVHGIGPKTLDTLLPYLRPIPPTRDAADQPEPAGWGS